MPIRGEKHETRLFKTDLEERILTEPSSTLVNLAAQGEMGWTTQQSAANDTEAEIPKSSEV